MLLRNASRRLITLNDTDGKIIELRQAGEAVEVPNDVCKTKFVKALVQLGDLVKGEESKVEDLDQDLKADDIKKVKKMKMPKLVDYATENGVEFSEDDNKEVLLAKVVEHITVSE